MTGALPSPIDDLAAANAAVLVRSVGARQNAPSARWSYDELLTWWRDRNFRDPRERSQLDWGDVLERGARVTAHREGQQPVTVMYLVEHAVNEGLVNLKD